MIVPLQSLHSNWSRREPLTPNANQPPRHTDSDRTVVVTPAMASVLRSPLLLLLLLLPLAAHAAGLYKAGSDVLKLTDANFEEKVLKADGVVVVEFYSPQWCIRLQVYGKGWAWNEW